MKKIFFAFFIFFLSFSSIFAYEIEYKYDEFKFIKKYDFAVIILEDENWSFEFKDKKYLPKFGIQFLEDYKNEKTKVEINESFLEKFLKNDTKLKNYFLIKIDNSKNIDVIKVLYKADFSDFEKLSKIEFLESFENSDILDFSTSSSLQSQFLKDFAKDRNPKFKFLFEKIWIDKEVLDFFTEKLDKNFFPNYIFLKVLENEIQNEGKNILIK